MQISYAADLVQLKMLRLLSNTVRQNVTLYCKRTDGTMKIMTDENKEYDINEMPRGMRIRTILNGCSVRYKFLVTETKYEKSLNEKKMLKETLRKIFNDCSGLRIFIFAFLVIFCKILYFFSKYSNNSRTESL